ncbi:MAG: mycothiol synthase [Chloroflexota bacterium]|jgi:ribosomal protein S18 acetylase RimI-like enzyme|nr:mycothiol synthase [Chloroflexota bacterium]
MRQGRSSDLPGLIELWREDVRAGRRDCVPGEGQIQSMMAAFDWEARSRIVDGPRGTLDGAALVFNRATELPTTTAAVEASVVADRDELLTDLTQWGLGLSRAAGAGSVQVWRGKGHRGGLAQLGLEPIRTWWRMDLGLEAEPPRRSAVAGYEMRDATAVPSEMWAGVHNRAFADHWRFFPRTERELMAGRPPHLSLMALASGESPAALALAQIELYSDDLRPQPVGVISSVGTLPEHRRQGLATWLVAEVLVRLQRGGARYASLYVDGQSQMRAFDVYRKLGFELAFETEVWEATFR